MSALSLAEATTVLKKHWGFENLKGAQAQIIEAVFQGKDVLAVLPTGYGKTATFQIPAMLLDGCALVFSPLIALMKDQVDQAQARGIRAGFINSHVDEDEAELRMDRFVQGKYDLFYVAPERIRSRAFMEALARVNIKLIVVDEAHCVSRWGHDFRPSYGRIKDVVAQLGHQGTPPVVIAVTATATADIIEDIVDGIAMRKDYVRVVGDPIRSNLRYRVWKGSSAWYTLTWLAEKFNLHADNRYLVYSGTRGGCEKVAEMLSECLDIPIFDPKGRIVPSQPIGYYHAGMTKEERTRVQEDFVAGTTKVVVATNAFGMGIDVPNIRSVIHFGIPGSLEDYVQESGRAGRDGKMANLDLLLDDYSVTLQERFLNSANPPYVWYEAMWDYLHEKLSPVDTLSLSGEAIAKELRIEYGVDAMGSGISGLLGVMEANDLIIRRYQPAGLRVEVYPKKFMEVYHDTRFVKSTAGQVMKQLWKQAGLPSDSTTVKNLPESVQLVVQRDRLAKASGVTERNLTTQLRHIEERECIKREKVFRGKTTSIVPSKYATPLTDHLSKEKIEAKRAREVARLQKMLEYALVSNPKQHIRDYFGVTEEVD